FRAGDVAEELERRRHLRRGRQMVDHLGGELRPGGELPDLLGVLGVVLLLGECGGGDEKQGEGQLAHQSSRRLAFGVWRRKRATPNATRRTPNYSSIPLRRISAISFTTVAESLPNGSATLKRISIEK